MARRQAALDLARQRVGWLISELERVARELRARRRSDAELARTIGNVVGALDLTLAESWATLAEAQLFSGHPDSAVRPAERGLAINPIGAPQLANAAYIQAMAGDRGRAEGLLQTLRQEYARGQAGAFYLALVHLGFGRSDSAIAWLGRSVQRREYEWTDNDPGCDPMFDPLKADPRFGALVQSTGMSVCPPGPPPTGTAAARR